MMFTWVGGRIGRRRDSVRVPLYKHERIILSGMIIRVSVSDPTWPHSPAEATDLDSNQSWRVCPTRRCPPVVSARAKIGDISCQ